MKPTIAALKEIVDQFPVIKRVEYENPEHQKFITEVLTTLRKAWPDIQVLSQDLESSEQSNHELNRLLVDLANRFIKTDETITDPLIGRLVTVTAKYIGEFLGATTQAQPLVVNFPVPSSVPSPTPSQESNTRSQASNLSEAGSVSNASHKSGTSGKSSALSSKIAAAKKKAASRKTPSPKASGADEKEKGPAAQSEQQPSTPENASA